MPWDNEEEGLTGAEYVPEWKDPYSMKLSFPIPPKYLQSCVHASLVLCALPSSLPLGIPFILQAVVWNTTSYRVLSSVVTPVLCPVGLTQHTLLYLDIYGSVLQVGNSLRAETIHSLVYSSTC